jgi:hypothetical protein
MEQDLPKRLLLAKSGSSVRLGLDDFLATVKPVRAHVVTKVNLARRRLDG